MGRAAQAGESGSQRRLQLSQVRSRREYRFVVLFLGPLAARKVHFFETKEVSQCSEVGALVLWERGAEALAPKGVARGGFAEWACHGCLR